MSEFRFSGVLRGERPRIAPALTVPLMVPADAEIVIEGFVSATETAPEGPYGDHTGYYNSVEQFPVMRVTAITTRRDPIYLTTFTGRPPDEPSVIGAVLNDLAFRRCAGRCRKSSTSGCRRRPAPIAWRSSRSASPIPDRRAG